MGLPSSVPGLALVDHERDSHDTHTFRPVGDQGRLRCNGIMAARGVTFATLLKRHRLGAGLTQEALAERASLSARAISDLERGVKQAPRQATLDLLATALHLSPSERSLFEAAFRPDFLAADDAPSPADGLPAGTVTFVLTDVEGSTRLWEQHAEQMRMALARHDRLIETLTAQHAGRVVRPRGEGDSRFCVFARATDAMAAAAAIQHALHAEPWPAEVRLRVRLALHTGEADLRDGDYYGAAVNRCARLRGLAYGGQTLLSVVTANLVRDTLPEGTSLRDLGLCHLRDLPRAEHVYQLVVPGVPADFPPINAAGASLPFFPRPLTSFVGRAPEIAAVRQLLDETRLVTLTGPGGTGKTRLALQVAGLVADAYADGALFVDLAPLRDHRLVLPAIAQAAGIREESGRPLSKTLAGFLRHKHQLLVLDNFEHVLPAAPEVAALLAACGRLSVLATSRAVLHISGEHDLPVPPLRTPDPQNLPPLEQLLEYEALQLFVERARAVRPDFPLTDAALRAVAGICARLDGLPLAIELGAARCSVLSPPAMLARLRGWLNLLTHGAQDAPDRHHTMRRTIAWSYDLLATAERALFRRLAVFAGSASLEAVEAICGAHEEPSLSTAAGRTGEEADIRPSSFVLRRSDVLDHLTTLVEKSLLRREEDAEGMPRFRLLETSREFALEQLVASDELENLRARQAGYFASLAEAVEPEWGGHQQATWLDRLQPDLDNFRVALDWCASPQGQPDTGLRLGACLQRFWLLRGNLGESRRLLERLLAHPAAQDPSRARARALFVAGTLAVWQGTDDAAAQRLHEESLALWRTLGDVPGSANARCALGWLARRRGDPAGARAHLLEAVSLSRAAGDVKCIRWSLEELADLDASMGATQQAGALYDEALGLARRDGDDHSIAALLRSIGELLHDQGEHHRAVATLRESLSISFALQDNNCGPLCLDSLARALGALGHASRAITLFGAADALRSRQGNVVPASQRAGHDRWIVEAGRSLSDGDFATAWERGRSLSFEQAVDHALKPVEPVGGATSRPKTDIRGFSPLTRREREVAVLIARGLTSREIASELVITERTAETHVEHILDKLGFHARSQIAAWAGEQGLLTAARS
jgi:predicted ATPase/class 3 adenylate cyclase/DNA-binding CsgD family transcriptional regulator